MFEKLFGGSKNPEDIEKKIQKVIAEELAIGINGPAMFHAFNAAKKENTDNNLGLTNNALLNIVKDSAIEMASSIEDVLMGGREQVIANINSEIERLRGDMTEEEQKS